MHNIHDQMLMANNLVKSKFITLSFIKPEKLNSSFPESLVQKRDNLNAFLGSVFF